MTRRITARRVEFVTGHDAAGQLPKDIDLKALADPTASTVIFMGKRTFPKLCATLIELGLPADQPAILAEDVSGPDQRITRSTVTDLATNLEAEISSQPALIVFGPLAEA